MRQEEIRLVDINLYLTQILDKILILVLVKAKV